MGLYYLRDRGIEANAKMGNMRTAHAAINHDKTVDHSQRYTQHINYRRLWVGLKSQHPELCGSTDVGYHVGAEGAALGKSGGAETVWEVHYQDPEFGTQALHLGRLHGIPLA